MDGSDFDTEVCQMTRETKIGLLVGLAFIVVFAMLLSHSAPTPPPGDPLQFAKLKTDAKPNVMSDGPGGLSIIPDPSSTNPTANSAAPRLSARLRWPAAKIPTRRRSCLIRRSLRRLMLTPLNLRPMCWKD